jgi:hypothetical protein
MSVDRTISSEAAPVGGAARSAAVRAPAPVVALVGWLVPGAGYLLVGQRARGITIGTTIVLLFMLGLLIAGVRVVEVPGYNASGDAIMVHSGDQMRWVMATAPISEIRNKPWAVPQVLSGPISFAAAAASVYAARPDADGKPHGAASHVRVNEIGSLYLSVAGLLNLMAMIDASHRAGIGAGTGAGIGAGVGVGVGAGPRA